ncbi:hypothetical protein GCM10008957_03400 [Deinococcus ruber]|uniref:Uncharacterized protein n=2 Tax=Deinococcus ruber TaxID=1848197 RepID=A0A918EZQ1_9DEIO|nr:hypothetical protein GCM10008957_03400 [Deinococcus ruber]
MALCGVIQGAAHASEIVMDTLLVSGGPSPCLAVRVNIIQDGKSLSELNLGPTGTLKVQKGTLVHFKKGQEYLVQASCISGSGFVQQSGLKFVADGRTIIVQFADNGFQIKRGGVAY